MNILKPASLASTLLLSGAAFANVAPEGNDISTLLPMLFRKAPGSYDGERC